MHRYRTWTEGTWTIPGADDDTTLFALGLNHRSASVALRERFAAGGAVFHQMLGACRRHCLEFVPLATCNRSEWMCLTDEAGFAACREELQTAAELDAETLAAHTYSYAGRAALEHLCGVAAGLDSLVLGETQILGQVKQAFNSAFEHQLAGRRLVPLYHQILHVAKSVRRETQIGEGALSYGSLSVQAAQQTLGELAQANVAIIGAGKMSRLAGSHLAEAGVAAIRVLNRTPDTGQQLADSIGGKHLPLEALTESLAWADIIVSATACPHLILKTADLRPLLNRRDGKPLCLIDLALPRDIDPTIAEDARVRLYDIDDFQQLIASNQQARQRQKTKAERLIAEKVGTYLAESQVELGTVIKALQERAESLRDEELQRLFRRFDHWSDDERDQVAQSMRLLLTRFLHAPVKGLREELAAEPDPATATQPVAWFSRLFKLDLDQD